MRPTPSKNSSRITVRIAVRYVDGTLTGHQLEARDSCDGDYGSAFGVIPKDREKRTSVRGPTTKLAKIAFTLCLRACESVMREFF